MRLGGSRAASLAIGKGWRLQRSVNVKMSSDDQAEGMMCELVGVWASGGCAQVEIDDMPLEVDRGRPCQIHWRSAHHASSHQTLQPHVLAFALTRTPTIAYHIHITHIQLAVLRYRMIYARRRRVEASAYLLGSRSRLQP